MNPDELLEFTKCFYVQKLKSLYFLRSFWKSGSVEYDRLTSDIEKLQSSLYELSK